MGLFSFFKKKKDDVKNDYTLYEMKKGFIVDYFLKTWEVKKVYEYDWGNNYFAREYLLDSGDESLYLYVEEDDELICSVWKKISIGEIEPDLFKVIVEEDDAPSHITYDEKVYKKMETSHGVSYEEDDEDELETRLINWTYKHKKDKHLISVNRTGEEAFEISEGHHVKEYEFSNILPI